MVDFMGEVSGQRLKGSVKLGNKVLINPTFGTWQEDYHLREVEFVYLKNGKMVIHSYSEKFIWLSIGILLNACGKMADNFAKKIDVFDGVNFIPSILSFSLAIVIFIVCLFIPNEYNKVMKKIGEHFKNCELRKELGGTNEE